MTVEIEISSNISEPYAVINTDRMTNDIQRAVNALETGSSVITAKAGDRTDNGGRPRRVGGCYGETSSMTDLEHPHYSTGARHLRN